MTKITNIGKAEMISLRTRINDALKALGEELGVELTAGNGSYSGAEGHFKLNIKVADAAVQEEAERAKFNIYCRSFDLEPEDFGAEFRAGTKRYKLLGFELKRKKYPIRVMDLSENKVVLLTELAVPAIKASRKVQA